MRNRLDLETLNRRQLPASTRPKSLRDWAVVGFRQRRLLVGSFLIILFSVLLFTWLTPAQYAAHMTILLKLERLDPAVSPDPNAQPPRVRPDLAEIDVNSEVELLRSRDLLQKVLAESNLHNRITSLKTLERNLKVEPLRKTKLIKVTYRSPDPQFSVAVLETLSRLYLEKHTEVHRMPGVAQFFQEQTNHYRQALAEAETRLAEFGKRKQVTAAPLEKEMLLRTQKDVDADMRWTRVAVSETKQRIAVLEQQAASLPRRLITQVRVADNASLLQQMKSKLFDLENQRTRLLSRYAPEYPLVQEVDAQIAKTKQAFAAAENSPTREETTDGDAAYGWVKGELVRARTDLIGLEARAEALAQTSSNYHGQAQRVNDTEIAQQDLIRAVKTAEENYLLYSRKQEQASISDALDQQRIVNVAVAEHATAPRSPTSPDWLLNLSLGCLLGLVVSVGLTWTADYLDHSFRTPAEVETTLNAPVLASFAELQSESGEAGGESLNKDQTTFRCKETRRMENGQHVAAYQRLAAVKFGEIVSLTKIRAVVERWKRALNLACFTIAEVCVSYLVLHLAIIIKVASSGPILLKRKRV